MRSRVLSAGLIAAALLTVVAPDTRAQDAYPSRAIHLIIPYSAGSPTDTYTRKISDVAQAKLGVPIVIENKAGASGVLGTTQVARAAPDGYTLLSTPSEPFIASTVLIKSVPYDSMKDFRFVTKLFVSTPALIINAENKIGTLRELIERARIQPVTYGSFGPGSFHQLSLEEFAKQAGIRLSEVPYRAPAQAAQAVLTNEVALGYTAPTQAIDQRQQGKIQILAVIGNQRHPLLPDVPSFVEAGYDAPILRTAFWTGLVGPAGMSDRAVARIHGAFKDALQDPDIQQFFARAGNGLVGNSPAEFDREIRQEHAQMIPVIRAMNIPPQ
jgi:tripartite-type tricarboxylate transporter receptor subunit TctC